MNRGNEFSSTAYGLGHLIRRKVSDMRSSRSEIDREFAPWYESVYQTYASLPPSLRSLYDEFPDASRRLLTGTDMRYFPPTRHDLLRNWMDTLTYDSLFNTPFAYYHYIRAFGDNETYMYSDVYGIWKNMAYWMAKMDGSEEASISDVEVSLSRSLRQFTTMQFLVHNPQKADETYEEVRQRSLLVLQATEQGGSPLVILGNRFEFISKTAFVYLLADLVLDLNPQNNSIRETTTAQQIVQRLTDTGLLQDIPHTSYKREAVSLVIEKMLCQTIPDEIRLYDVMQGIADSAGIQYARDMLSTIRRYFPDEPPEQLGEKFVWLHGYRARIRKTIDFALNLLEQNEHARHYSHRSALITDDLLSMARSDPNTFEEMVFNAEVSGDMEIMFGGKSNEEIQPVYERSLDQDKTIALTVMMIADILGYPREKARKLAAIAQFTWGLEDCIDALLDRHPSKRGRASLWVEYGDDVALDLTMLALSHALDTVIDHDETDKELERQYLTILRSSVRGDMKSRDINWDTARQEIDRTNVELDQAFSWFPLYIGKKIGLPEAGKALSRVLEYIHGIGKFLNDVGDNDPNVHKHEPANDVRQGIISAYWLELLQLPDNEVSQAEKSLISQTFAEGKLRRRNNREPNPSEVQHIEIVTNIGRRCIKTVCERMMPVVASKYDTAIDALEEAKRKLPVIDERNSNMLNLLKSGLDQKLLRFKKYTQSDSFAVV